MVRGPHPSRRILKYISSEMPCRRQNSLIDIASAFGSAPGGLRRYFGPRSAVTIGLRHSPRAIAVASLKLDGRRYGGDGILPMSELSGAQNAQFGSGGLTLFAAERALPRRAVRNTSLKLWAHGVDDVCGCDVLISARPLFGGTLPDCSVYARASFAPRRLLSCFLLWLRRQQ